MSKYDIHSDNRQDERDGHNGSNDQLGEEPAKANARQRDTKGDDVNGKYGLSDRARTNPHTINFEPRAARGSASAFKPWLWARNYKMRAGSSGRA